MSSSSSSMVYFPVFDDPSEQTNVENTSNDGIGIFNMFSNLFRPSSSSSRIESTASNVDQTLKNGTKQALASVESNRINEKKEANSTFRDGDGPITSVRKRLIDYKKSEFRRYWMPDSSGNQCYDCSAEFNTFRRRHHCRLCGQIFCKSCAASQVDGNELGYNGVLRLCNFCSEQVDAHIALRRERRETVKSFSQIESDDVFIGVPNESNANHESNLRRLHSLQHSNGGVSDQIPATEQTSGSFDSSRSSSAASGENRQLELMFEQKMELLLDSLMEREQLQSEWRDLLWSLSKTVAERIAALPLRSAEALNILDFLHIKKLHLHERSALGPSCEIVNGVAFSKCLAHSGMPSTMNNVSLMLLNGTISYERVLEKFTSLEPMMAQERQYLRLQCDRVLSRRVSLLLTESSISASAIDMLMAEGISIVANVKANVLLRIARATSADILNSLDANFLQPRMGFVPDFCQREFTTANGRLKRLILLENCSGNFGVTVFLKGNLMRELVQAKRLLRFLVLSRYSSRLEMAFLTMFNSVPRNCAPKRSEGNFHCHICELNMRYNVENNGTNDMDRSNSSNFLLALSKVQLTNSPAIHFCAPFLATPSGHQCPLLPFMKGAPLFRFLRPTDLAQLRKAFGELQRNLEVVEREEAEQKRRNATVRHRCLSANAMAGEARRLLDRNGWLNFRASSALHFRRRAQMNKATAEEIHQKRVTMMADSEANECLLSGGGAQADTLNPYNHQGIAFLYCANARRATYRRVEEATRIFCTGPYVLQRQFYHGKDTSLGAFLLNCCFNTDFKCKGCDRPMLEHLRRIVHGNTRIEVVTRNVGSGGSSSGGAGNRNSSTASLATAAVAAVGPFVSGGVAASLASLPSSAAFNKDDDELNRSLPLDELPSSIPNNNCASIICWLRCNSCSSNSSIVTLPDEVFHLSFAKFVDYLSNGSHWVSLFPSSIDLSECHHCTFHSHNHFFALGNFVTQFRISPIYPLNVLFAPIPCTIENDVVNNMPQENPVSPIVLRDTVDAKGANTPDVGSIIAHALTQPSSAHQTKAPSSASLSSIPNNNSGNKANNNFGDFVDITHVDEHCQYTVKVYYAEQFERFRSLTFAGDEDCFVRSLSTSAPWYPQGGKSGAVFSRTDDERFVLKTLNRFELDAFKNCALKYIDYVLMALIEKKLTALCKIFGAYTVNFTNKQTGQSVKSDLVVMEYLFHRRDIKQIWDLKGSLRNRMASTKTGSDSLGGGASSSVLLDENYIQNLWRNQIYVNTHSKTALSQAIINDSHFLADQGIMDYSLLAGVCRGEEDEVIIGIVDYLRTYTFDKKVESAIKNAIPLTNSSTVISPEQYCRRFYEAIDGYFAVAPDQWTSETIFT